ncbi:mitotic checkpoint serine/threonine-protein kinase BUB1 isoform X1 [Ricinus communis]|uniref:mitotic checkpoint serine/threonine-protein kinase BUB1 isoform X1 n=1 Tax=Ricinus communis TaxID=3988 RepID=UPI00201A5995|nr:mitotic checkpoint serine/threonine-protein kinase BUB1 isoform X1 [Ricinus communis]
MYNISNDTVSVHDPLFPWLLSIKKALDNKSYGGDLNKLLLDCINTFKHNPQYRNDPRFLKIWLLYLEGNENSEIIFKEMEENNICSDYSLLYELYAGLLELKENWQQAHMVYQIGISRKAKPLESLKGAHASFLQRMCNRKKACSLQKVDGDESIDMGRNYVNPWSTSTTEELLKKINPHIRRYDGYHPYKKAYPGQVNLSSLGNASRNKIVKIGGKLYQIKGCAGQGGFAKVYKAYVNSNPDDVVALKIQTPPFPWEFYMYRQLDHRISNTQRSSFGFAHEMHVYSDYSILVCDYLHGTLHDVINSYVVIGKSMEEVLCIYYTIEMLYMLETLHGIGLIHGDFKPDNLLLRYSREDLNENEFEGRTGSWADQGLCLVDWGKGIDLHLFPDDIKFEGDCRTSGFRCIEMQEKKQWRFQVDTYGLCVVVHTMLHNSYMEIEKKATYDGGYVYLPKTSFRRYWNVDLWKELFTQLLNNSPQNDKQLLQNLRERFQDYLCSNSQLLKKLKDLLAKQRLSFCSA